ncbi:hypothetical protein F4777DRAFT_584757 [Nemania sp. FL0916]|nr:hypothetical protein F4777DRAFT_584757 [Nemania sp. FL0916]
MARTKQTAKRTPKELITWTRFYLPQDQEWPTWSVDHDDVHIGPLADVPGRGKASLGRMVDNPEQAAYIIEWATLDDLKNFLSSPACAEFLRNLPEYDNSQVSVESGSALQHLALDEASLSSRFLTLKHATEAFTFEVEGRVTFTTFVVPRKVDNAWAMWNDNFKDVFRYFLPRGSAPIRYPDRLGFRTLDVWFLVLSEDRWVERKFGELGQVQEDDEGRTIFCYFQLWLRGTSAAPEHEEALASDPQSRESWAQAIAQVMPPAAAWEQERWDIVEVPRFYPPEPEWDPEIPIEVQKEERRLLEEYIQFHASKSAKCRNEDIPQS